MLDLGLKHITLQVPRAPADLQKQEVKLIFITAQLQIEPNEEEKTIDWKIWKALYSH